MFPVIYVGSVPIKKIITTDDILNDRNLISQDRADKVSAIVEKEVAKANAKNKPMQKRNYKGQ